MVFDAPSHAVRYRLGEGIIGKVVERAAALVVVLRQPGNPRSSTVRQSGPELPGRRTRFICVPILLEPARHWCDRRRSALSTRNAITTAT